MYVRTRASGLRRNVRSVAVTASRMASRWKDNQHAFAKQMYARVGIAMEYINNNVDDGRERVLVSVRMH